MCSKIDLVVSLLATVAVFASTNAGTLDQFISSSRLQNANSRNTKPQCSEIRASLKYTSIIKTAGGSLRGKIECVDNEMIKPVIQFLGVPYAKPPTGKRRWKKPEPAPQWNGVLNATKFGSVCPQANVGPLPSVLLPLWFGPSLTFRQKLHQSMSEDCLFLNIYIPETFYTQGAPPKTKNLPVMIYFHGHTFSDGSGNLYDASMLASYGEVMVVTFNYRLGVLGFLSTMDSAAYGNYGLWDQLELVRWVSNNIGDFGGDKQRITVFGSGSGAAGIGMLMLSPQTEGNRQGNVSEGFFKRAILQSGTALAPWAIVRNARKNMYALSRKVGCSNITRMAIVQCLKTKTWNELISVTITPEPYDLAFGPVVDGASRLLSETPATLMKRHELLNYDVMIGVSQGEGFGYVQERLNVSPELFTGGRKAAGGGRNAQTIYQPKDFAIDVKKYVDAFYDQDNVQLRSVEDVVQFMYTNWIDQRNPDLLKRSLMDLYTDRQWVEPAVQVAEIESDLKHAAYFYTFYHQPGAGIDRAWVKSGHGEELPFVFGAPLLTNGYCLFPYNFTKNDEIISTAMMTYWANFATSGDPMVGKKQEAQFLLGIGKHFFREIKWPRYYRSDRRHLKISTTPAVESHYRAQKVAFWRSFVPRMTGTSCGAVACDMYPPDDTDKPRVSSFSNSSSPRKPVIPFKPNKISMESLKFMTDRNDNSTDGGGLSLQLSITLAVGFVLLFVNIIAFAVVSYHKERDKFRIEKLQSELKAYRQHEGSNFRNAKSLASANTTLESCVQSEPEVSTEKTHSIPKSNGMATLPPGAKVSGASAPLEQLVPFANAKNDGSNILSRQKPRDSCTETSSHQSCLHFKSISPRKGGDGAMTEASSVGSISDVAFINNCGDCNDAPPSYWNRVEGAGERQTLPFPSRQSYHQAIRGAPQCGESSSRFQRYPDPIRCHSALGVCYERGEFDLRQQPVHEDAESEFPRSRSSKGAQNFCPSAGSRVAGSALNLTHGAYDHPAWAASLPRPRISDGLSAPPTGASALVPSTSAMLRSVTTKL